MIVVLIVLTHVTLPTMAQQFVDGGDIYVENAVSKVVSVSDDDSKMNFDANLRLTNTYPFGGTLSAADFSMFNDDTYGQIRTGMIGTVSLPEIDMMAGSQDVSIKNARQLIGTPGGPDSFTSLPIQWAQALQKEPPASAFCPIDGMRPVPVRWSAGPSLKMGLGLPLTSFDVTMDKKLVCHCLEGFEFKFGGPSMCQKLDHYLPYGDVNTPCYKAASHMEEEEQDLYVRRLLPNQNVQGYSCIPAEDVVF